MTQFCYHVPPKMIPTKSKKSKTDKKKKQMKERPEEKKTKREKKQKKNDDEQCNSGQTEGQCKIQDTQIHAEL